MEALEALIYLIAAFAVCIAAYGVYRVVRREGKPSSLRELGHQLDDELHAMGREAEDKLRERLRREREAQKGGGHGDDKGG
ncbi:MAG: hypothetical protein ACRCYZ_06810 [Alphaproteobacteria bacterium]